MSHGAEDSDDRALRRLQRVKQMVRVAPDPIGPEVVGFFRQSVARRQGKLERIAGAWQTLVPESLACRCALQNLHGGTLTVLVDSAPHRFELKQLLLAGLEAQLCLACRTSGLRRVTLKPGRWYAGEGRDRRVVW